MAETEGRPAFDFNGNEELKELMDDWTNLSADQLVRGNAVENIEARCLELCQAYLGGSWANAKSPADLTVKRISGGFTNQLYHVHLNESVTRIANAIYPDEPSDVAIKLYQEKHMKNYNAEDAERFNDTLILTIMGETGLGPVIYGIFADGFIQGYYEHEQFRAKHQQDPKLIRDLMRLLARINHLSVPMRKESNLLFEDMRINIDFAYANCQVQEIADELDLKYLKDNHLMDEYKELQARIQRLNAPVVFTHSDFRGSNLLVTVPEQKILACDLEYCGYGTRGFDFASFIMEWGKKDMLDMSMIAPDESVIRELLSMYIEEVDKLIPGYSAKPENSLEAHLAEVRVMMLANNMFFLSLMAKQTDSLIPSMPFDLKKNIQFVEIVYKGYFELKNSMIEKGHIEKLN